MMITPLASRYRESISFGQRIALGTLLLLSISSAGCGGGLSQQDMMRGAIRRPADDKGEDEGAMAAEQQRSTLPPPDKSTSNASVESLKQVPPAVANDSRQDATELVAAGFSSREELFPDPPTFTSELDQHMYAVTNMQRIADALENYRQEHGTYPLPYMTSETRTTPMLSWRVQILPQLGYERLFNLFRTDQPWNGPHNKKLLALIPPEFQSPERLDEKTNFQVPVGEGTLFPGTKRISARHVEDGLAHTATLIEVDDSVAVPWTQPADWSFRPNAALHDLGNVRPRGFLVAWGGGLVSYVPANTPALTATAMFTRDRGEQFAYSQVHFDPQDALLRALEPASVANSDNRSASEASTREGSTNRSSNEQRPVIPVASDTSTPHDNSEENRSIPKVPPPSEIELQQAMQLLRDIYERQYHGANTLEERRALAKNMLDTGANLKDDPAGRYATLQAACQVAADAADVNLALTALHALDQSFQIDKPGLKIELLKRTAGQKSQNVDQSKAIATTAYDLLHELIVQDRYDEAEDAYRLGVAAARKSDQQLMERFHAARPRLEDARTEYNRVRKYLKENDPHNPDACLAAGKYICFVKNEWERGLPLLAKGNDEQLQKVAQWELEEPRKLDDKLRIADAWWDFAERSHSNKEAIYRRANWWYQRLLPRMPDGLLKVKIELRLKEFANRYGPGQSYRAGRR